jgi:hypothetical protein
MRLAEIKNLRDWIHEIYIFVSVVFYWIMTSAVLNPVAISLLVVLTIFVCLKSRTMGIIISIVFILLNLYMVLALLSELNTFTAFNKKAVQLLLFGATYLGMNTFISIRMLIKWTQKIDGLRVSG